MRVTLAVFSYKRILKKCFRISGKKNAYRNVFLSFVSRKGAYFAYDTVVVSRPTGKLSSGSSLPHASIIPEKITMLI
jgi:hypothetical protein